MDKVEIGAKIFLMIWYGEEARISEVEILGFTNMSYKLKLVRDIVGQAHIPEWVNRGRGREFFGTLGEACLRASELYQTKAAWLKDAAEQADAEAQSLLAVIRQGE